MFPFIHLGLFTLQSRGLILLIALWLALTVFERVGHQAGVKREAISSLSFTALVVCVIGARIGYIVQYLPIYLNAPLAVVALDLNTLSWPIGLVASATVSFWRIRRQHLPLLRLLDALAMGLPIIVAGLALADLASGDGYGAPAQLPWSITLWGALRHPTQIYDLLAALGIGIILWRLKLPKEGQRFSLFVALYAGSRLLLEAFHGDSAIIWGGLRTVQLWSLFILVTAMFLMRYLPQRESTS